MNKLIIAVLFVVLVNTSLAQTVVAPPEAELNEYPIMPNKVLSKEKMKELGLSRKILINPWTGFNWSRKINKFLYETLPIGTVVLVNGNGIPKYKADCVNRLIQPSSKDEVIDYCTYPSFTLVDSSVTNNYYDYSITNNNYPEQDVKKKSGFWHTAWPYVIGGGIIATIIYLLIPQRDNGVRISLSDGGILPPN